MVFQYKYLFANTWVDFHSSIKNQTCYGMTQHRTGEWSWIALGKRERVRQKRSDRWESRFTSFHYTLTTQHANVNSDLNNQPSGRKRGTRIEQRGELIQHTETHTSITTTNKHLTCHCRRSWSQEGCVWSWSCGQAWVDSWCVLWSPSAVDLESPDGETRRQSVKPCRCYFVSLRDVNHGAQLGSGTEHINTDICASHPKFGEAKCHE